MLRVIAAFLTAPALAITFMCVLFGGYPFGDALVISLMITYITYPFVLAIGPPLFWLLYQKQWLGLTACIMAALLCAAIVFIFMLSPLDHAERLQKLHAQGLFIFASAVIGGGLFWFIGVRHNQAIKRPVNSVDAAAP
ncbi:MAG: hypothetical protein ACTS9Y_05350 [Methylophilus sp.]|uniref:hypothetical protein n=1 Tax=Methylophilus sp. TaxID=29541 RepID=UPI003F9FB4B6